ncbi:MAG: DUF115 domain-containing protein [Chlamydiota bacterium]|jgi:hypothetical protein
MDKRVLCVYGASDIASLQKKYDLEETYLVFLEDDQQEYEANKSLADQNSTYIYFIDSIVRLEPILKEIAWKFLFLEIELQASSSNKETKRKEFEEIQKAFDLIVDGVFLSASDYSDFGLTTIFNIYRNLFQVSSFHTLKGISQKFLQKPAIICGAGPSLNEAIPFLKKLDNQALIFAGGAALEVLKKENITPHIAACLDKYAENIETFESVPTFFSWKIPPKNLSHPSSLKVLCSTKSPYLFDKWIEENLGLSFDTIDMGWTVTTFMTSLALYLGCGPIIFVGCDLCFNDKKMYADHVKKEHFNKKLEKDHIVCLNKNKETVRTQKDWLMASFWFQSTVKKHKSTQFFTTSRNGLSLGDRVQDFSLEQLLDSPGFDCTKEINSLLLDLPLYEPNVDQMYHFINEEISNELEFVNKRLETMQGMFDRQEYHFSESWRQSWSYQYILFPLWEMMKYLYIRNIKQDNLFSFTLELYKTLYFKDVLEKHKKLVEKFNARTEISNTK